MTPLELQALFRQSLMPIDTLGQGQLAFAQLGDQRRRQDALRAQALSDARANFDYETQAREAIANRTREARRGEALKNGQALLRMQEQFDALNTELTEATQLTPEQEARIAVSAARQAGLDEKWQAIIAKDPRKLFADARDEQDRVKQSDARDIFQALVQQQTQANAAQPKAQQVQRRLARVSRDMDLFTRTADIAFDPEVLMREQAAAAETEAPSAGLSVSDAVAEIAAKIKGEREAKTQAQAVDPTVGLPVPEDVRLAIQNQMQQRQVLDQQAQASRLQNELRRAREEMGLVDREFMSVAEALRGGRPVRVPMPSPAYAGAPFFLPPPMMAQEVDPTRRAVALGQRKQQLQTAIDTLAAQLGEVEGPPVQLPEFVVRNGGVPTAAPEVQRMTAEDMLAQRADAIRGISARDPWTQRMLATAPWR